MRNTFICKKFIGRKNACNINVLWYYNQKHHKPHIHVQYQENNAVFEIDTGEIITGDLPIRCKKFVHAWMEIHKDELIADWNLAVNGERVFKIKPLD